jgi:hypothetical protein
MTLKQAVAIAVLTVTTLAFSLVVNASCSDPGENYGKVARIYPQYSPAAGPGTFFTLKEGVTNALNGAAYYHIPTTTSGDRQAVYRSMQDLLVEAAKSGWTVRVRTTNCGPSPTTNAIQVEYIVIDY